MDKMSNASTANPTNSPVRFAIPLGTGSNGAAPPEAVVTASPARARYTAIRRHFTARAEAAEQAFSAAYDRQIDSLDTLVKEADEIGKGIIEGEVKRAVDKLVAEFAAYSISEESFFRNYCLERLLWGESLARTTDQYNEIVMNAEQLDAYRTARREGRGKWIGGGFGVGGAVKGALQAGALNLATNAVHGTINALAKGASMAGDAQRKEAVFKHPETKASLCHDVFVSVFQLHYAFIDAANDVSAAGIESGVPDADTNRQRALFDNIQKGRVPAEKLPEALTECLTLSPFNQFPYDFILERFGDATQALEQAATFFGVEGITQTKATIIKKEAGRVLASGASPQQKLELICQVCRRQGCAEQSPIFGEWTGHIIKELTGDKANIFDSLDLACKHLTEIQDLYAQAGSSVPESMKAELFQNLSVSLPFATAADAKASMADLATFAERCQYDADLNTNTLRQYLMNEFEATLDFSTQAAYDRDIEVLRAYATAIGVEKIFAQRQQWLKDTLSDKLRQLAQSDTLINAGSSIIKVLLGFGALLIAVPLMGMGIASLSGSMIFFAAIFGIPGYQGMKTVTGTQATKLVRILSHWVFGTGGAMLAVALGALLIEGDFGGGKLITTLIVTLIPAGLGWHLHTLAVTRLREQGIEPAKQQFVMAGATGFSIVAMLALVWFIHAKINGTPMPWADATKTAVAATATNSAPATSTTATVAASTPVPATAPVAAPITEAPPAPATQLPFVGKRSFNFAGGNGTGETITIEEDGHTKVEFNGSMNTSVDYEGPFTNPIREGNGSGLLFKDQKVYQMSGDNIAKNCMGDGQDCVSDLY
jgi:hypothetical protein